MRSKIYSRDTLYEDKLYEKLMDFSPTRNIRRRKPNRF